MARRALPAAFATITKIIPPAFRRDRMAAQDPRSDETKVVFGDYYAALASGGLWSSSRSRPWPVERAVAEGYERIIYVFRPVETIAGQASRLKFQLNQGTDLVDDHPLYHLLNVRANPMETGRQFRSRLGKQILLSKRGAFVEVTKARNGTPLRFDLLPPGRTRPVPGSAMSTDENGNREYRLIDHYEIVRADGTRSFIPAESVIWFREPHPLDPYSGVTPLEAAGMSAELDFFARLYNTTFMKNDARPGGILGISGDMDPDDMERLEDKFGHGPAEAGKLTVIAGDISYVDSVVRPRDMQYGEMADRSKNECLTAFGVPESMLGNAASRTFDNAGQEGFNFWTITMPPFLDLQITGFDELSEPELEGFFDVSHVPALAAAEAAKREEARSEFSDGLISADEYREATGKEPYGLPATRALILSGGTTLVPTSEADQKALGGALIPLGQAAAGPAGAAPNSAVDSSTPRPAIGASPAHPAPGHRDTGPAADAGTGQDTQAAGDGEPGTPSQAAGSTRLAAKAIAPPPVVVPRLVPARATRQRAITSCQVKAAPRASQTPPQDNSAASQDDEADPDREAADQQAQRLEAALAIALAAVAAQWAASKLLPDPLKWRQDAEAAVAPLILAAAFEAASRAFRAAGVPGDGVTPAGTVTGTAAGAQPPQGSAARAAAAAAVTMTGAAAQGLADRLAVSIAIGETADLARETAVWAAGVAVQAATATVNAAADLAASIASALTGRPLVRVWRTRRDTRVRETHRLAEGQRQPPGQPFTVGGWPLMYPGDPAGPLSETAGCRCRISHRFGRIPAASA